MISGASIGKRLSRLRLGRLKRLIFILVLSAVGPPHLAFADCKVAPDLAHLLRYAWAMGQDLSPDFAQSAQVNALVQSGISAQIATEIEKAGHADAQVAVALLIQNLEVITRYALSEQPQAARAYAQSAGFEATRINAFHAYQTICHDGAETLMALSGADEASKAKDHNGLSPLTKDGLLVIEDGRNWGQILIALWFIVTSCVIGLHYALIAAATHKRSRHLCKIPARLEIAMQEVSGYVTILGLNGNRFEPEDETNAQLLEAVETGMYCTITIGKMTAAAKTNSQADPNVGMLFSEPIDAETVKELLELSLTAPKPDRAATSSTSGAGYRFGKGRLPELPDSP